MKKSILILLSIFAFQLSAQESSTKNSTETNIEQNEITESTMPLSPRVKRFSVGLKIGLPNLVGGSIEGVTPFFKNRIAPYIDYSQVNPKAFINDPEITADGSNFSFKYFEFGSSFYFKEYGKGFYAGIGFGRLNVDFTLSDVNLEENGNKGVGKASTKTKVNITNLKIGVKTGGTIYFRGELGYGFGTIPKTVEVKGIFTYTDSNGNILTENGTSTEEIPGISKIGSSGIPVLNIGFGISF